MRSLFDPSFKLWSLVVWVSDITQFNENSFSSMAFLHTLLLLDVAQFQHLCGIKPMS